MSPAAFPFAVTVFTVPPLLNANPFAALAVNEHDPTMVPPLTAHVVIELSLESDSVTDVSDGAKLDPVTVTVTPLGPDEGLSIMLATVPVNVAVAVSLAILPFAITEFAAPLLLKEKPLAELAVKVQDPPPEPEGETVIVQRVVEVGPVITIVVSVDANPATVAVTITPLGPDDGESVRLVTVAVNRAVALSKLPSDPFAVTV
ncbi:MAG: hypothetical protein M1126_00250 [Candidatus Thermoplasmatota archaeon]|nr:hypothetical protein [Candidatus Thermoplasmatota archaeon]